MEDLNQEDQLYDIYNKIVDNLNKYTFKINRFVYYWLNVYTDF